jgi:hypothetical protein
MAVLAETPQKQNLRAAVAEVKALLVEMPILVHLMHLEAMVETDQRHQLQDLL